MNPVLCLLSRLPLSLPLPPLPLQPNRVCIWQFSEDESAELVEPELVCECEVDSDVMDLRFLDEQRVVASFSNGCVTLFRYRSIHKVL